MPRKRQHGGYRQPRNPAPTSGPGALSRRTDTQQPQPQTTAISKQPLANVPLAGSENMQYGDQTRFRNAIAATGLPQRPAPPTPGDARAQMRGVPTGESLLFAPTAFPDQPVTHGADAGPGPGSETLGLPQGNGSLAFKVDMLRHLASLPYAGQETFDLLRRAQDELALSNEAGRPVA